MGKKHKPYRREVQIGAEGKAKEGQLEKLPKVQKYSKHAKNVKNMSEKSKLLPAATEPQISAAAAAATAPQVYLDPTGTPTQLGLSEATDTPLMAQS